MSDDLHRVLVRRAIAVGLLIWLLGLTLLHLEGHGVPRVAAMSLVVLGIGGLPLVLAWPWIRKRRRSSGERSSDQIPSAEHRYRVLVTAEVALLSAVLMVLLMWRPA